MENKQMKCIKGESCLHCGSSYCRFVDELNQLKAENERLEAHLATLDAVIETGKAQYKALKQTLTEIKEIAESRRYYPCSRCIYKQILQKISEVIPNEN